MKSFTITQIKRRPIPFLVLVLLFVLVQFVPQNVLPKNNFVSRTDIESQQVQVGTSTLTIKNVGIIENAYVTRVIDGDTIEVVVKNTETGIESKKQKVRLIGINAPESVDPRRPVQCMGKEASLYVKSVLVGETVVLTSDTTQTERDVYGRLLRYVFLEKNLVLFNQELIEKGYASEYTYKNPYAYQTEFVKAEARARAAEVGLWNRTHCPSNNHV